MGHLVGNRGDLRKSGNIEDELDNNQFASPFDGRSLRLPYGCLESSQYPRVVMPWGACRSCVDSVANASNYATNDHLSNAVRTDLKNGACAHDRSSYEDRFAPAKRFAEPDSSNSSKETAYQDVSIVS